MNKSKSFLIMGPTDNLDVNDLINNGIKLSEVNFSIKQAVENNRPKDTDVIYSELAIQLEQNPPQHILNWAQLPDDYWKDGAVITVNKEKLIEDKILFKNAKCNMKLNFDREKTPSLVTNLTIIADQYIVGGGVVIENERAN